MTLAEVRDRSGFLRPQRQLFDLAAPDVLLFEAGSSTAEVTEHRIIMKTPTRLLFGVRTTGTVSLTITASGQLSVQVPDLRIRTSGQDVAIPCSTSTWVATLDVGDHVVYLPLPNDNSLDGPLTVTLSMPATIVGVANASGAPLVSWTAATATSSDPKNPLPPPATGSLDISQLADSAWLCSTLSAFDMQAIVERSA